MIYLLLFYEFAKTGLFTVGGALAAIPLLQELSDRTNWFTHTQLADMIAISESTPGPIGINMATYVGFESAGLLGGLIASLGMITPPLIITLTVARLLNKFRENKYVESAFYALRPASVGLISAAAVSVIGISLVRVDLWKQTGNIFDFLDVKAIILAAILFFATNKFKFHPIIFIVVSAAAGIIFSV